MKPVYVCGWGCVSPAGWDVPAFRAALARGTSLPVQNLERPGWSNPLRVRQVPDPPQRPAFLRHPRLRRSSALTHYLVSAALEAWPEMTAPGSAAGLIVCLQTGCVQYSERFFAEVVDNPATASPLLFPETVFAAPASHLAALGQNVRLAHTLMGDAGTFLEGLALGAAWIQDGQVDRVLVLGAEETNWLRADAIWHLDRRVITTGGAGAVCLGPRPRGDACGVRLEAITEPLTYSTHRSRITAAQAMRAQLPVGAKDCLLCDGLCGSPRMDPAEEAAWRDWPGRRLSVKTILGEGLMAAAAWQCVAACDAVAQGGYTAAHVSIVGPNQQAVGARLVAAAA